MLIFKQGKWIEISLPEYVDPSWGVNERTQLAHLLNKGLAFEYCETIIYEKLFGKLFGKRLVLKTK
jgi:hypothetical protein